MVRIFPLRRHARHGDGAIAVLTERPGGALHMIAEGQIMLFQFPQTDRIACPPDSPSATLHLGVGERYLEKISLWRVYSYVFIEI